MVAILVNPISVGMRLLSTDTLSHFRGTHQDMGSFVIYPRTILFDYIMFVILLYKWMKVLVFFDMKSVCFIAKNSSKTV